MREVLLRKLLNAPIFGQVDFVEQLMVPVALLGVAYCQAQGGNVRMSLFLDKTSGRMRWAGELLSYFSRSDLHCVHRLCERHPDLQALASGRHRADGRLCAVDPQSGRACRPADPRPSSAYSDCSRVRDARRSGEAGSGRAAPFVRLHGGGGVMDPSCWAVSGWPRCSS
ncbi:MAG: TRAP transporter small permease [Rhodobiaceae bacterium]|nr:TRAP transporter small permease [Rhodobiaceae bacterium]